MAQKPPPRDPAAKPAPPAGAAKKPSSPVRAVFDLVGVLAVALGVALLVKAFVFDVFVIPSGSMEPNIHGRPDGGDRILCVKPIYRFREPRRWELMVFRFPYDSAVRRGRKPDPEARRQDYIKRVAGLPGETVAIARGDLWVAPRTGGFRLATKDDAIQRSLWIPVYDEDFARVREAEFFQFWRASPDGAWTVRDQTLAARPGPEGVAWLAYRPRVRAGSRGGRMEDVPGVPDRYVVRQPVRFFCDPERSPAVRGPFRMDEAKRTLVPQGCGGSFLVTVDSQKVAGRCPHCGAYWLEDGVVFYHRRSGLPGVGRFEAARRAARQSEKVPARGHDYHMVPDLRLRGRVKADAGATVYLELSDEGRPWRARLSAADGGYAEVTVGDAAADSASRAAVAFTPDTWHDVEFYRAERAARLFVDGTLALERNFPTAKPREDAVVSGSGARVAVAGGGAVWSRLSLDRDIYYFTGLEDEYGRVFPETGRMGEYVLGPEEYLGLGDNAPSSSDSRDWGPIPAANVKGAATLVWWPPHRAHRIPTADAVKP